MDNGEWLLLTRHARLCSQTDTERQTPLALGVLQLTGSSSCQVPVGNHLPLQFDYLFSSKDAQMVLFRPSFNPPSSVRVCLMFERICFVFLFLELL